MFIILGGIIHHMREVSCPPIISKTLLYISKTNPTDWDICGFYIPLLSEEDYGTETTARAAAIVVVVSAQVSF